MSIQLQYHETKLIIIIMFYYYCSDQQLQIQDYGLYQHDILKRLMSINSTLKFILLQSPKYFCIYYSKIGEINEQNEIDIQDWLNLYNKFQDDYFLKKGRIQYRHFLPRTYFYIPQSIKNLNITGQREPTFNEDFFINESFDRDGTYIQRSIQFANPQFIKFRKNREDIEKLITFANEKNQIIMIQKFIDDEIHLNNHANSDKQNNKVGNKEQQKKFFVNCKYFDSKLFTDFSLQELKMYNFINGTNEFQNVFERILGIIQYVGKAMILETKQSKKNVLLTLQLGFTKYENHIKPFLKNILPFMEYTQKQYSEDFIENKLTHIDQKKIYCLNDRYFKLFKYDYDYRIKRVHVWCNKEFIYHQQYFRQHSDTYYLSPLHCRNLTWTKEQKILSLKQSDIVFRRYLNRQTLFKKNVTQQSYLVRSWVIDLKNTFAILIKKFDQDQFIKNYQGLSQIPETFEINLSSSYVTDEESDFFYNRTQDMWISKPINMIGGKGIKIYKDNTEIIRQILEIKSNSNLRNRYERLGLGLYWREHWINLLKRRVLKRSHLPAEKFRNLLGLSKQKEVQDISQLIEELQQNKTLNTTESNKKKTVVVKDQKIVIQRYIQNPLLLHKRKFDLRSYVIVASADPFIVFFRHGYVRLTYNLYDKNDEDLMTHLVNTHIQKNHPQYKLDKDDSHWSMSKFEQVMREEHKVRLAQVQEKLYKKMKEMLTYIFLGSKNLIGRKEGLFQIFGTDYMFDENLNPYLIEINDFPWLQGGTSTHEVVCSETVYDFLELSLYANSQIVKGEKINVETLLSKCETCEVLINEVDNTHILQDYS